MGDGNKRFIDSATATVLGFLEEEHRKTEELKRRLNTDSLTGLYSKDFMLAEGVVLDSQRNNLPYGVVMIDVDGFKKSANDTYGHGVGDEVLKAVAKAMKDTFRPGDMCCRPSGDEFVAIMPEFNLEYDTKDLTEALEKRLEKHIHETFLRDLGQYPDLMNIGISIGLSTSKEGRNFAKVMKDADNKMYASKTKKGRNR